MKKEQHFCKYIGDHFEEIIMIFFLAIITLVIMLQVVMRYFFGNSLSWPEELARYCYIASAFLSIGYCIQNDRLLKVDVIIEMFPEKVRNVVSYVNLYITLAVFAYFFYYSLDVVSASYQMGDCSTALRIPLYILYASQTLGFGLGVIRLLQKIVATTIQFLKRKEVNEAS